VTGGRRSARYGFWGPSELQRQTAKRHRPYSCTEAPGRPVFSCPRPERTEGAQDARGPDGPTGLDASRHRGCRSPLVPQVRQFPGVPRAVFVRFAPHRPRWTYHFRQTGLTAGPPIHRSRPKRCPALLTVPAAIVSGATRPAASRPGRLRLGPPGPRIASPMRRQFRPPLPAPRLETLIRHPSVTGRDHYCIYSYRNIVKRRTDRRRETGHRGCSHHSASTVSRRRCAICHRETPHRPPRLALDRTPLNLV